ncbi:MAG: hypothetical protein ACYDAW_09805, partial [Acidithiobacillus ferrivorans]
LHHAHRAFANFRGIFGCFSFVHHDSILLEKGASSKSGAVHIGWQVAVRKRGFPVRYKTFRTKAEAMGWAAVTESEMVRGVFVQHTESEQTT